MDYAAIAAGLNAAVPFAGHVGAVVESVGAGECVVTLPDEPHLRNHVGSLHAGALFTAAETASGGAFVGAFAEQMGGLRPLVREASIRYSKVARGPITARAAFATPIDEVRAALDRDGRADFDVDVTLSDAEGVDVAALQVRWNVKVLAAAAG